MKDNLKEQEVKESVDLVPAGSDLKMGPLRVGISFYDKDGNRSGFMMLSDREKALSWWNDQPMEFKDSIDWPEVMGLDYGHCIEVLYLKEQAHLTPLPDDYVQLNNIMIVDGKGTPPYPLVPSEKVLSTETDREEALKWWASQHYSYVNLITVAHPEGVTPELVTELYLVEKEYWAKEGQVAHPLESTSDRIILAQQTMDNQADMLLDQRELIQSLLDVLRMTERIVKVTYGASFKDWIEQPVIESAITKAQEYLGTK